MAKVKEDKNPVIEELHGIQIRRTNKLTIRVDADYYRDLINQSHRTALSMSKIMFIRSAPCQLCKCDNVTLTVKKVKHTYHIADNGGSLIKNINGKGHDHTSEDTGS